MPPFPTLLAPGTRPTDVPTRSSRSAIPSSRSRTTRARVAIDPFYPQAHAGWAQALRAVGRLEEAPPRFAVAVRVDAGYAPAYRGWADALTALGRDNEARPLIAQADAVERRNREPLSLR